MIKAITCDACGRPMYDAETGITLSAITIGLSATSEGSSAAVLRLYPEVEVGYTYNVCWVCWLRSLGVKLGTSPEAGREESGGE